MSVYSSVTYRVMLDGVDVGTFSIDEPENFDGFENRRDMLLFLRNESSWCANSMKVSGVLTLRAGVTIPWDDDSAGSFMCNLCTRVELAIDD